jgi:hypothetical protein
MIVSPPYCIPAPNPDPNPNPKPLPVPNSSDYINGLVDGIKLVKHYSGGSGKPGTTKPSSEHYKRDLERRLGDGLKIKGANLGQDLGQFALQYTDILEFLKVLGNLNGVIKRDETNAPESGSLGKRILDDVEIDLTNALRKAFQKLLQNTNVANNALVTGNGNGILA